MLERLRQMAADRFETTHNKLSRTLATRLVPLLLAAHLFVGVASAQSAAETLGSGLGVLVYYIYLIGLPVGVLLLFVGFAAAKGPGSASTGQTGRVYAVSGAIIVLGIAVGPYVINAFISAIGVDAGIPTFPEVGADAAASVIEAMSDGATGVGS